MRSRILFALCFISVLVGQQSFTKITSGSIVTNTNRSGLSVWGDYNNDGNIDVLVCNRGTSDRLFKNHGNDVYHGIWDYLDYTFTEIGSGDAGHTGAAAWADYDLDGELVFNDPFAQNGNDSAQKLKDLLFKLNRTGKNLNNLDSI